MFILLGKIATLQTNIIFLAITICIVFLTGVYIIVRWVPARTDKRTTIDKIGRIRRKKRSLTTLILLCFGSTMFIKFNLFNYTFASILGVIMSLFFITPWGYSIIITLDNILNRIQGGITND